MKINLYIESEDKSRLYLPVAEEGVEWSLERRGAPGKLTFSILQNESIVFSEGSTVQLEVDGKNLFFGFVFTQKRDKKGLIDITAYDQLRYLNNKDTYVYEDKTASQFIRMLADDFSLKVGEIEETGFVIQSRVEDNATLFDMVENALGMTLENTKNTFVLYDDFGKLTLKSLENMKVGEGVNYLLIDEETGENYEYSSSIDTDTYNKIKLSYENEETGKRDIYIAKSSENINKWGVLQHYDTLKKGENGQAKADALLSLYNKKTRQLKIERAFGDTRVRAGSLIVVNLDLGDAKVKNFMLVEKVTHIFKHEEHFMDLTLRGGEFVA